MRLILILLDRCHGFSLRFSCRFMFAFAMLFAMITMFRLRLITSPPATPLMPSFLCHWWPYYADEYADDATLIYFCIHIFLSSPLRSSIDGLMISHLIDTMLALIRYDGRRWGWYCALLPQMPLTDGHLRFWWRHYLRWPADAILHCLFSPADYFWHFRHYYASLIILPLTLTPLAMPIHFSSLLSW